MLRESELNEFVYPHLKKGARGPNKKISFFKTFNYILWLMHTGGQWHQIPIDKDANGEAEIHYTNIYRAFVYWVQHKCFDRIFKASVVRLFEAKMLDLKVIHGDA